MRCASIPIKTNIQVVFFLVLNRVMYKGCAVLGVFYHIIGLVAPPFRNEAASP